MNKHKANGFISLLMFKIVDYDYYIKAAKSIYVLSKNLKSVWNRGWLWLPCISAGNHNKTQDKSECGAEQWGAARTGVTWPSLMLSLPPPSPSPAPAKAENICSQLKCNKTNHRLQRKLGRIRKSVHIKAMFDNELELRFVTLLMLWWCFL